MVQPDLRELLQYLYPWRPHHKHRCCICCYCCTCRFFKTSVQDLQWLLLTPTLAMLLVLLFLLGFPSSNILPVTLSTKRRWSITSSVSCGARPSWPWPVSTQLNTYYSPCCSCMLSMVPCYSAGGSQSQLLRILAERTRLLSSSKDR